MLNITRLYCGKSTAGDSLRYGQGNGSSEIHRRPVVVWTTTRRCNLRCIHCYSSSEDRFYSNELSTAEAEAMIRDFAKFGVPVVLFSGGEPLMRSDILEIARFAREQGIHPVISTNGTLITESIAQAIKDSGVTYVGISLDGIGERNDLIRGKPGAFESAVRGLDNCLAAGVRVGLRLTLTQHNYRDIDAIFDFVEKHCIPRLCFYHLVYAGRGSDIREHDLTFQDSREAVNLIIDRAADFCRRGLDIEVLTVDNHCDAPYLYMRMVKEASPRAEEVLGLLIRNGGNSSGIGIAGIDNEGFVHPDQFWSQHSFGNVREHRFSEIWEDTSHPLLAALRDRKRYLKGRCAVCKWLDLCNGGFRVRAEATYGDMWAPDPSCYLTDEEIGLSGFRSQLEAERGEQR